MKLVAFAIHIQKIIKWRLVMKIEWGIKRQCKKCAANFYDLNKNPIVCPKCSTSFNENDFVSKYSRGLDKVDAKRDVKLVKDDDADEIIDTDDIVVDDADLIDTVDNDDFDNDVTIIERREHEE